MYTVTVYSENQVGLLNQISIIFTRRNLNIWSLSVSSSAIEGVHKFTIACRTSQAQIEKVVRQIEKRIDVIRAFYYTDEDIVYQEIALYKVPTIKLLESDELEDLIRRHHARILEMNTAFTVLEKSGHCQETQALFDDLNRFGVLQFVRSGRVAVTKSSVEHVSNYLEEQEIRRAREAKTINSDNEA
jgi:acetolactate synthase-1/3 small subunit